MKEKLKYYLYLALLYPLALLPLRALYAISDLIYVVLAHLLHYRDKVVTQNLVTSFPEKNEEEIKKIKKDFYRHLGDIIVETIKLLHVSDATLKKHVRVEDYDIVNQYAAENKGVILFLGHYGNWELVPVTTLYYTQKMRSYHIYKPLRDKASDRLMLKIRGRLASTGIPQRQAVRTILGLKNEGAPFMVGFIADQRSNSSVSHQRIDFLNHLTPYNVGGETIGDKIHAEYLYLDISLEKRGQYVMRFVPMKVDANDGEHPYTRLYMQLLEKSIRRQPALWLWSHRRWLYK